MNLLTIITKLITSAFANRREEPLQNALVITNSQAGPIRVYLEPWGEGYTLQPDQEVAVRINNQGHQLQTALAVLPGGDLQLYIDSTALIRGSVQLGLYDAAGAPLAPD